MKMKMYLRGVGTGVVCTAIIMGLALGRNKTMSQEEIMAKAKEYGMVDASEMASQVAKAKADALSEANAKIAVMKEENKDTASSSQDAAGSGSSVSSGSTVNSDPNPQVMGASRAGSQGTVKDVSSHPEEQTNGSKSSSSVPDRLSSATKNFGSASTTKDASSPSALSTSGNSGNSVISKSQEAAGPSNRANTGSSSTSIKPASVSASSSAVSASSVSSSTKNAASASSVKPSGSIIVTIPRGYGSDQVARALADAGVIEDAPSFNTYLIQNGKDRYVHSGTVQIPRGSSYGEIARIICR